MNTHSDLQRFCRNDYIDNMKGNLNPAIFICLFIYLFTIKIMLLLFYCHFFIGVVHIVFFTAAW